jgi:hypothetical protein
VGRVLRYSERRKWKQLLHACRLACGQYTKLADEASQREPASSPAAAASSPQPKKRRGCAEEAGAGEGRVKKSKRARAATQSLLALRAEWATFDTSVAEVRKHHPNTRPHRAYLSLKRVGSVLLPPTLLLSLPNPVFQAVV